MIDFGDALLIMGALGTVVGSILVFLGLKELKKKETEIKRQAH